jgi:hypothetical protein
MFSRKKLSVDREPITKKALEKIANNVKYGENLTLVWLPGSDKSSFGSHMQNTNFFTKLIPIEDAKKLIFVYIDLKMVFESMDDHINATLGKYSEKEKTREKIQDITSRKQFVYLVINNIKKDRLENFEYLNSLKSINPRFVNFIYFVTEKNFHKFVNEKVNVPTSFFHNAIQIKYFDREEIFEYIGTLAKMYKMKLTKESKELLYQFCGGVPVLLKNAVRLSLKNPSVKDALNSIEMVGIVRAFWDKFNKKEQEILFSASQRKPLPPFHTEIKYLQQHKLLNQDYTFSNLWIRFVEFQKKEK